MITDRNQFADYIAAAVLKRVQSGALPFSAWEIDEPTAADDLVNTPWFTYYATDIGELRIVLRLTAVTEIHWRYQVTVWGGPQRELLLGLKGSDDPASCVGLLGDATAQIINAQRIELRSKGVAALGE